MEKKHYQTINETLYHEVMPNGLNVYLLKKDGFSKTYGLFATNFGSVDTTFIPLNGKEMIKVSDGIAHFLEHKMFEMEDGDASDKFSSLGASTNAFTSSNRTAYLFSTGSNEVECTELLLDFVQDIYLTEENVEKEKGIICQEIKMYDDDPDWQNYFGAIQNLYHVHPFAVDIAGSVESVNQTTKEELEICYHTFYHPSNMVLFIVGQIDPESLMKVIYDNQAKKDFKKAKPITRLVIDEPNTIKTKETIQKMDVFMPKITMGIKVVDIPTDSKLRIKREMACQLILDYLFSKSSALYNDWLNKEWINDTFGGYYIQERDYACIQFGGDTNHIDELKEALNQLVMRIGDLQIPIDDFERLKRKMIGNYVMSFNSIENIANSFIRYYFENFSSFDLIDTLNELSYKDVLQTLPIFDINQSTFHIVLPK